MGRLEHRICTPQDVKTLGTILAVWAHPDDESFLAAGILMTALRNGQQVTCVTATKGEAGVQDAQRWPPEKLGDIRADELRAALKILGINQHHWLGYPDNGCQDILAADAVGQLVPLIQRYQADTILTFGPEGWTGNPDHRAVSAWVSLAIADSGRSIKLYHVVGCRVNYTNHLQTTSDKINLFYNIEQPPIVDEEDCDIHLNLDARLAAKKCQALRAMRSQTEALFSNFRDDELLQIFEVECFKQVS